jgi:hypothetical protein
VAHSQLLMTLTCKTETEGAVGRLMTGLMEGENGATKALAVWNGVCVWEGVQTSSPFDR